LFLVHHNLSSETNPLSTSRITISSTVNENENKNYSQPFQETNVTVDLFDCMKVEDQNNSTNTNAQTTHGHQLEEMEEEQVQYSTKGTQTDLHDQIQELRQEQEKVSQNQTLTQEPTEEEIVEELYGAELDMDDFNFMGTYLYNDLPSPEDA